MHKHTGSVQTFTAPFNGNYMLEIWGASGACSQGDRSKNAGKGGYSRASYTTTANKVIYLCIGGEGKLTAGKEISSTTSCGGYNGGGNAQIMEYSWGGAGGGGATHISSTNRGVLSNYVNNKSEILIVAGGGGGADGGVKAGDGGGNLGTDGEDISSTQRGGKGGTQDSGGNGGNDGTFGKGGDVPIGPVTIMDSGGAGGGGWYGGGSTFIYWTASGGGGSGYINTSLVQNASMETGIWLGDGKALITWMPVL